MERTQGKGTEMMRQTHLPWTVSLLIIASLVISACEIKGKVTHTPTPTSTPVNFKDLGKQAIETLGAVIQHTQTAEALYTATHSPYPGELNGNLLDLTPEPPGRNN